MQKRGSEEMPKPAVHIVSQATQGTLNRMVINQRPNKTVPKKQRDLGYQPSFKKNGKPVVPRSETKKWMDQHYQYKGGKENKIMIPPGDIRSFQQGQYVVRVEIKKCQS